MEIRYWAVCALWCLGGCAGEEASAARDGQPPPPPHDSAILDAATDSTIEPDGGSGDGARDQGSTDLTGLTDLPELPGGEICSRLQGFDYKRQLLGTPATLYAMLLGSSPDGSVTVGGQDSRAPSTPFTFDWGDGEVSSGFFDQQHVYVDTSRNYLVSVTAYYADGTTDAVELLVWFVPPVLSVAPSPGWAVTIPDGPTALGTRLVDPPALSYFADSAFHPLAGREVFEGVLSVAAKRQREYTNQDVVLVDGGFEQVVLRDPQAGGSMYSLWYTTPVAFAAGDTAFAQLNRFSSNFHEMGHNITLNSPAAYQYGGRIDGNANALFSETMAQLFQHVTAYDLVNNAANYGLGCELAFEIRQSARDSMAFVRQSFEAYIAAGKPYASWNDPASTQTDETLTTFLTLAYKFFEHADKQNKDLVASLKRVMKLLQTFDSTLHAQWAQHENTSAASTFRATLMVAALSYGLQTDLRSEFKALSFPIDDALYQALYARP